MENSHEVTGDLHLHTDASPDLLEKATYSLEQALEIAKGKGLSVIAVTEHGVFHEYDRSQQLAERHDMILVPAVELRGLITEGWRFKLAQILGFSPKVVFADILALGVTEPIPERSLPLPQLIEIIHKQSGLAVIPHPSGHPGVNWYGDMGKQLIKDLGIDGIEAINASIPRPANIRAKKFAQEIRLPVTGGSDARTPEMIGKGLTVFSPDLTIQNWQDCLGAIRVGKTSVKGESLALGPFFVDRFDLLMNVVGIVGKSIIQGRGG